MGKKVQAVLVFLFLCSGAARAQNGPDLGDGDGSGTGSAAEARKRPSTGPIVAFDDPVFWFTNSLLSRGYLSELDQGVFPVREMDFRAAIEAAHLALVRAGADSVADKSLESGAARPSAIDLDGPVKIWLERIQDRLHAYEPSTTAIGLRIRPGGIATSQKRLDLLRTENHPEEALYSFLSFESWFTAGNWTAAWGWRHDRFYDQDPDGLDSAHRLFIRGENAYVSYDGVYASFLFGRVRQNWGGYSEQGLLLSDNPRPMDHLSFRLGTPRLSLRSSISELDSITGDGRFTGTAGADSVRSGSTRRYLAVHRLGISRPGKWTVGLMHAILYSGANSGLSLKFANPLQLALLSVDEKPKNEENNGLLGGFFQFQRPNTLFQGQVTLDDFDIVNSKEPTSIAGSLFAYRSGVSHLVDLEFGAVFVTARTFNSQQEEGKYLYLGRGIATQFSDFISFHASAHWLGIPGWRLSPRVDVLLQGEQDIRSTFPAHDQAGLILDGTTERTIRPSIRAFGLLGSRFDVQLDVGLNVTNNLRHVDGESSSDVVASASISYRLDWSRAF